MEAATSQLCSGLVSTFDKTSSVCTNPHLFLIHFGRANDVPSIATGCYLLSTSNYAANSPADVASSTLPPEFISILTQQLKNSLMVDEETKHSPTAACVGVLIDCLGSMRVVKDEIVGCGLSKIIGRLHRRVQKVVDQEGGPPKSHEICGGADPKIVLKALATLTQKWSALWETPVKATHDPLQFLALRKRLETALNKQKEEDFKKKKSSAPKTPSTMKNLRAKRQPNNLLKSAADEFARLKELKRKADIQLEMVKKRRMLKEKTGDKIVKKVTFASPSNLRTIQTFVDEEEPSKVGDAVRSPSILVAPVPDVLVDEDAIDSSFFEDGGGEGAGSLWLAENEEEGEGEGEGDNNISL
ncbi:hypothetical protein TrLO_g5405 [Triparma laevis f. longispina]|uniref:Uncharacterized protein n=1 Tax=Triparma laevis f. longispina TaxID=1714387 RepID=A0A9W7FLC8_9STRA|nr:hypothetical protein TrLO_g5405 [Triparma laevis f. longispina]